MVNKVWSQHTVCPKCMSYGSCAERLYTAHIHPQAVHRGHFSCRDFPQKLESRCMIMEIRGCWLKGILSKNDFGYYILAYQSISISLHFFDDAVVNSLGQSDSGGSKARAILANLLPLHYVDFQMLVPVTPNQISPFTSDVGVIDGIIRQ